MSLRSIRPWIAGWIFAHSLSGLYAAGDIVGKAEDPNIYNRYVGSYQTAPQNIVKIYRTGTHLMQEASHGDVFEMLPESDTQFFINERAASFTFVATNGGPVSELIVHEGGLDHAYRRIH